MELICIGERIYNAAASEHGGVEQWRTVINKPRIHSLDQTSSILNDLFGRDHTAGVPFISIGELIHASIPKTGKIMQLLHELGADAYSKPSGPLNYVKAMIESQVASNPDYIAVNLDAIGQKNPHHAVDLMIEYVRMVHDWSRAIPICIDSNDNEVIITGLKKWYNTDQKVTPPLLSTIKFSTMDEILALKKHYDYGFTVLLEDNEQLTSQSETSSVDRLHLLARHIFDKAVLEYGFKSNEIFFELDVCPLAADLSQKDGVPGRTYVIFETAKKIKQDRQMAGVHCLIRPSIMAFAGHMLKKQLNTDLMLSL